MKTPIFCYAATTFIIFSLSSCMALYKKNTTVKSGSIPADFGKTDAIVLAVKEDGKSNGKYMENVFKKYYHGKYELISKDDLKTLRQGKYADSTKYRYVFYVRSDRSNIVGSANTITYRLTDRVQVKGYKSACSAGVGALMKAYVINMEKTRKANQAN